MEQSINIPTYTSVVPITGTIKNIVNGITARLVHDNRKIILKRRYPKNGDLHTLVNGGTLCEDASDAAGLICKVSWPEGSDACRMSERSARKTRLVSVIAATVIALACGTNVGHARRQGYAAGSL